MPSRAPSVCGHCGSAHLPGERCDKAKAVDRERKARFDLKRPTANRRGYDGAWRKARAEFLTSHPTCAWPGCDEPATTVDHIRPHRGDDRLFWDRSNWQPLCSHHHNSLKQSHERKLR